MLTKEECLSALENMAFVEGFMNLEHMLNYDCMISLKYKVIYRLIKEHFSSETELNSSETRYKELYEGVLKDNELLAKENEQMRRKMYGLQQTVENMKRKEERRYGRMVGEKRE